ncbi:hypothetical protein TSUD_92040 [Trifolium subterraneum]|uniref:Uncharacterized protein n=1 Tax=Trifolium subterraneum TaxID=3900 RepID=A0A2Z6NNB1_TRISU|nr:hypothetical protein TSUD_92040 [Trifolium subterraneum]
MGLDPVTHRPRIDHLNLITNLQHFLLAANVLNNFSNTLDITNTYNNNALKLQTDAAKFQLLQNMLQIHANNITPPINPFGQSSSSSHQENFLNEVLGLNNQSNFLSQNYHTNFQGFEMPQMQNNGGSSNSSSCLNQNVDEVFDATNSSLNSLPNLVSLSPEYSAVMENKVNQNESSDPSSTSTTFEMLGDFMYEDLTIDACWKDLLE